MVLNLASQGSGGYDFMEFVSNVTPDTQMPVMKIPYDLTLIGVTFHWMGLALYHCKQVNRLLSL